MNQTEIHISKSALLNNYAVMKKVSGQAVWPVVKSNAYGHGIESVLQCLSSLSPEYIIVQNISEAERVHAINSSKVLVLGAQDMDVYKSADYSYITPVISSLNILKFFCELGTPINFHLKINTGMNRQGIDIEDIELALSFLEEKGHMHLEGILTHFSSADEQSDSMQKQESLFNKAVDQITAVYDVLWIHANNSAGALTGNLSICNAVRGGIALYGLNPLSKETHEQHPQYKELQPVLSLHSTITQTRTIKAGQTIGYGDTFIAQSNMRIGVLPLGYYEGVPRSLSNNWNCVDIKGVACPIVGRVSMNIIVVDLTNSDAEKSGVITIFSSDPHSISSVKKAADAADTISYEITTRLQPDVPRIII